MSNDDDGNDSDYIVEEYICPNKISRIPVNDASADILGNFDDSKRDKNGDLINEEEINEEHSNGDDDDDDDDDDSSCNGSDENEIISDNYNNNNFDNSNDNEKNNSKLLKSINSNSIMNIKKMNPFIERENNNNIKGNPFRTGKLTDDAVKNLLRGVSKSNRYVLYVTNIDCQTTKNDLDEHFQKAGQIKNIRIPKKCLSNNNKNNINKFRNLFAFVEMCTLDGFKNALQLHNTELNGKLIKIQISEGGKKKSANKKNILKQKNRKLSELRMEYKSFTKSGKNYDKNLKKEISKDYLHKNKMNKWKTIKRAK